MDPYTRYSEEALRSQDGRKLPLTAYPGGPVIGEATLKYDPGSNSLGAEIRVVDPTVAMVIGSRPSSIVFRQGELDGS